MYTKQYLEASLAVALGGRLAEELTFGEAATTTGASNDLERVANTAQAMVSRRKFGVSATIPLCPAPTNDDDNPTTTTTTTTTTHPRTHTFAQRGR